MIAQRYLVQRLIYKSYSFFIPGLLFGLILTWLLSVEDLIGLFHFSSALEVSLYLKSLPLLVLLFIIVCRVCEKRYTAVIAFNLGLFFATLYLQVLFS